MTSRYAKYPVPVKFHKKNVGEMQLDYAPPRNEVDAQTRKDKTVEGAVYLDLARPLPGGDGNKMDWANKVTFKLDAAELSYIVTRARMCLFPIRRTHKTAAGTATLTISKGRDIDRGDDAGMGTYKWSLGRAGRDAEVYINDAEMHMIFNLFERLQPFLLGWMWVDQVGATAAPQPQAPTGGRQEARSETGRSNKPEPHYDHARENLQPAQGRGGFQDRQHDADLPQSSSRPVAPPPPRGQRWPSQA